MRLRYACAGGGSRRGRPAAARPSSPSRSDAVDVLACGLCGSDVEKLGTASAGAVLGHEVVVRAGGRRLALVHHRPCGECAQCRAGHESTCEQFAAPTIVPGGFAERVRAADGVELPDSLDDARATMVEPLACVLRGAERVPRGRVLVVGNGFVGRLFGAVLERRGDDVFAVDADPAPRRARARRAGRRRRRLRARRRRATRSMRSRPAAPCSSSPTPASCPRIVVYRRELTVVGSRSATPATMRAAAALLPELDVPEPTVLPLERFAEGLELFREREALKVVFVP